MRKLLFLGAFAAVVFPISAFADSAQGTITAIDPNANTMQLTDGKSYALPGEFDFSVIQPGMKVTVFYDVDGSNRYVTDIEPEGENTHIELPDGQTQSN
ncbi:DUF1344 domain-containing protein [Bartonella sp. HY406]|uniref:DUF1344 domain-containing protein n=1 Tax=Bartonella sp. HY406 TaxID=2979331 RepID=UPI0021CAD368|nr:DUF1344 domain-containing protein [Bartonella sp. HY406]UXN04320.1 DUF1344 domain-containing protein [Bartonella sp. HY406]